MAAQHRHQRWCSDERGEVSSWLILAAGLAAAAVLAAATLQFVTTTLADEVAYAAGVNEAASAPPSASTLVTALNSAPRMLSQDGQTQVFSADGMAGLTRQADGRTVVVAVDEDGYFHFTQVDESGNTERYVATINDEGRIRAIDPTARDSGLMSWHYEDREALNVDLPPTMEDAENSAEHPGWVAVDQSQAALHQDPSTPGPDVKYVHPDGREVIYNIETGEMVTDPEYAGSYNYVHMPPKPESWTDVGGWVEWGVRGIGHTVADVLPWAFDRLVTFVTGGDGDDPPPPAGPEPGDDWPDEMGP